MQSNTAVNGNNRDGAQMLVSAAAFQPPPSVLQADSSTGSTSVSASSTDAAAAAISAANTSLLFPASPQPDEPVMETTLPGDSIEVLVPTRSDSHVPISEALRNAHTSPAPADIQQQHQSPPPPPLQQPQQQQQPSRTLQREESDAHMGSSPGSEDRLFLPSTVGQHVSSQHGHDAGDGAEHSHLDFSEHLAHGTHEHSQMHTKDELALLHSHTSSNAPSAPHGGGRGKKKPVNLLNLFNRENIKVTVVPIIGGLISGYTIALVPVYSQLFVTGTNCALYSTPSGCEAVPFADCVWRTDTTMLSDGMTRSVGYCGWRGFTCRAAYPNDAWVGGGGNTTLAEASCLQDSRCTWSYSAKECQNPAGYSQKELSIFAGSMIAGNMVGAILGGPLVTNMGTRLTFLVSGFYSIITCIMGHMDAYVNDFWVLAVSRFVLGIFMGLITVACPLYVHENANPKYKEKMGTMFQVFGTTGSFIAGIIGIGIGETIHYDASADPHISGRMQGITAGQTVLSILLFLLGIFSAETKVKFKKGQQGALNQNEFSYWQMAPRLLMAVALNATFRFTGFNALANFGPKLMSSFKIQPFLGVFIIMTVNFAGGLVSMPVSLLVSPRVLFLFGSCFISCMCLFLCGIPVYPGVASESVTNNCAVVGICLYIFAYEVFVGPSFYVLCQEIFPPSFRPRGNSFAQLWQFIFNLVINVCYSIAVVSFSGGPEGNQHKGQSIIFIFFGGLGIILFLYEFFFLDLWDDAAEAERKLRAGENAEGVDTFAVAVSAPQPSGSVPNPPARSGSETESEGLYLEHDLDRQEMDVRV